MKMRIPVRNLLIVIVIFGCNRAEQKNNSTKSQTDLPNVNSAKIKKSNKFSYDKYLIWNSNKGNNETFLIARNVYIGDKNFGPQNNENIKTAFNYSKNPDEVYSKTFIKLVRGNDTLDVWTTVKPLGLEAITEVVAGRKLRKAIDKNSILVCIVENDSINNYTYNLTFQLRENLTWKLYSKEKFRKLTNDKTEYCLDTIDNQINVDSDLHPNEINFSEAFPLALNTKWKCLTKQDNR